MAAKKVTTTKKAAPAEEKDPGIAALISAVGLLILAAPGIGYFYIDNVKKGIEYLLAIWAVGIAIFVVYMFGGVVGGMLTFGISSLCCMPVFALPYLLGLVVVWDVYLEAKGEKTILPLI
jgi:TM2 domain-containing membrane protein YozV